MQQHEDNNITCFTDTVTCRKRMSRINMAFFALIFISQLTGILLDGIISTFFPALAASGAYSYILSAISFYLFGACICRLILTCEKPQQIQKQSLSVKQFIKLTIMAWGLMLAGGIVGNVVNALIGSATGVYSSNYVSKSLMTTDLAVAFVYTVILAPVVEELVCRKILVQRTAWLGDTGAIIMCGLVFGLFHGNLYQFFYAFAVGALFGFVYLKTGKLKYTIIMHMIMNFLGGFIPLLLSDASEVFNSDIQNAVTAIGSKQILTILGYGAYVIFEYGLAIAGIVLLITNFKNIRRQLHPWNIPKGSRALVMLGNAGGVLMLASALAVMTYTYILS